ncbi:MAG: hypothetical protein HUK40_15845 [Desulfobacter sp.]|nr:hypothetical protein [Desulfobacter sp.]WDP87153.1 MAG: hypothetical protein HUN05_20135 [Desulfobacter sp.]
MYKGLKSIFVWVCLVFLITTPAQADPVYNTRVRVIHARTGPAQIDPGIKAVVREIQPVFKYTRFNLLNDKKMMLAQGQKGSLFLPGNRSLVITPVTRKKNRIQYHIRINAKGNPVFQTNVMLKNHDSVTIGGPKFKKGVLLLNILGSTP